MKEEELGASLVTLTCAEVLAGSAQRKMAAAKGRVSLGLLSLVEFA